MSESFENGKRDGVWTLGDVYACGFQTAQECLEHQERVYQDELTKLSHLQGMNPEYGQKHASYLEGFISSIRASLRALIRQGF